MIHFYKRYGIAFVLVFLLLAYMPVFAGKPQIKDISLSHPEEDILFSATVDTSFADKMTEAVKSGAPTTLTFFIQINKVRGLWFDKDLAEITVNHTIKQEDNKTEYTVIKSWNDSAPVVFGSFEEARDSLVKISELPLCKAEAFQKDQKYQIRIKAELDKPLLPFYLRYVLFFVSNNKTDWHKTSFTRQ